MRRSAIADRPDPLPFVEGRLSPSFRRREVVVAPGGALPYDESDWRDAIVVVRRGEVELEDSMGDRRPFIRGAVLCLDGLSLRALHNPGREPAVLVAVARRCPR